MNKIIYILNGPNLNLLGTREPHIYGHDTLDDIGKICQELAQKNDTHTLCYQSNHEGELIDWVQEAGQKASALIINPGAYGHTSIGLHDSLRAIDIPIIEVHLSQTLARESFRHHSYVAQVAHGSITGFGKNSYILALHAAFELLH